MSTNIQYNLSNRESLQIAILADSLAASALSLNSIQGYENFIQARESLIKFLQETESKQS